MENKRNKKLKLTYKVYTFPNGAKIVYKKARHLKGYNGTAMCAGFCRGSSVDTIPGIAHFMEHQLVKETKKLNREEMLKFRNEVSSINAATSEAYVYVFGEFSNRIKDKVISVMSDCLFESVFKPENLDSERGVIHEELNQKLEVYRTDLMANHFSLFDHMAQPYPKTLGTHESIDKITVEDIEKFREQNFKSNYFVLSAYSKLSCNKIKKLAEKYFISKLPEISDPQPITFDPEFTKESKMQVIHNDRANVNCAITVACDTGLTNCENIAAFDWVGDSFNINNVSLTYDLRSKGLVYSTGQSLRIRNKTSSYTIQFQTSPNKLVDTIRGIGEYLHYAYNNPIPEARFEALRERDKQIKDIIVEQPTDPRATSRAYIRSICINDEYYKFNSKKDDKKLKREQIFDLTKTLFNGNTRMYITVMGNVDEKELPSFDELREILVGGLK